MTIEIGTTVLHPDQWTRKEFPHGIVVEIGAPGTYREGRARVKWIGFTREAVPPNPPRPPRNLRTWVALNRLMVAR